MASPSLFLCRLDWQLPRNKGIDRTCCLSPSTTSMTGWVLLVDIRSARHPTLISWRKERWSSAMRVARDRSAGRLARRCCPGSCPPPRESTGTATTCWSQRSCRPTPRSRNIFRNMDISLSPQERSSINTRPRLVSITDIGPLMFGGRKRVAGNPIRRN